MSLRSRRTLTRQTTSAPAAFDISLLAPRTPLRAPGSVLCTLYSRLGRGGGEQTLCLRRHLGLSKRADRRRQPTSAYRHPTHNSSRRASQRARPPPPPPPPQRRNMSDGGGEPESTSLPGTAEPDPYKDIWDSGDTTVFSPVAPAPAPAPPGRAWQIMLTTSSNALFDDPRCTRGIGRQPGARCVRIQAETSLSVALSLSPRCLTLSIGILLRGATSVLVPRGPEH